MAHRDATSQHTQDLWDYLTKEGEALPTDEDQTLTLTNPEARETAPRPSGTVDAPWGEEPPKDAVQLSSAARRALIESRQKMLDELFTGKDKAEKADQALVGQLLDHGASGDFQSKNILLENKAKQASQETLSEMVARLF